MLESETLETETTDSAKSETTTEPTTAEPMEATAGEGETDMARKTLVEQLEEEAAAKAPKAKRERSKKREAAAKPKKEKAPKKERVAKTPKPKKVKAERQPKGEGKRKMLHREAQRAEEGHTIGFTREGTKTAMIVDYVKSCGKEGATPEGAGKHFKITAAAARVRLWRAKLAGKLEMVDGEGRAKRFVLA